MRVAIFIMRDVSGADAAAADDDDNVSFCSCGWLLKTFAACSMPVAGRPAAQCIRRDVTRPAEARDDDVRIEHRIVAYCGC